MLIEDYDELDYLAIQDEYETELIDKAIRELPTENIRWYLATNGDAIEKRVNASLEEAEKLLNDGYFRPALIAAVTSIEIILRFFVLRPIVHGAFLSDEWAQVLLDRVVSGRTYKDRELLLKITKHWSINLEQIKLPDGKALWSTIYKDIWPCRNNAVHMASSISEDKLRTAIQCIRVLMNEVVTPLAMRIGIDRSKTGVWHIVKKESPHGYSEQYFRMDDPFK